MDKNIGNKNRYMILLTIFSVILLLFGGTLAYWQWTSSNEQKTLVTFSIESKFQCSVDGGGDITNNDVMLVPSSCNNNKYVIKRKLNVIPTVNEGVTINYKLWLNVLDIGTGLNASSNFRFVVTTSETDCTDTSSIVYEGNFKNSKNGKVQIFEKAYNASAKETYWLYIWLDKAETNSNTMNNTFHLTLGGSCDNAPIIPVNEPVLDSGMIPITIASDGTLTTVSPDDNTWYNYNNRKWANSILVTETSRSKYIDSSGNIMPNVTLDSSSSDILAYYVWIPRYKYMIYATSDDTSPNPIEISWEPVSEKSTGAKIDEWLTHPAFTFGSKELPGIWVGKFETTGTASAPTIIPNKSSLRGQNVSTQFTTSLKFAGGTLSSGNVTFGGNSTYGLSTNANSHMMKNNEWGAVAYLSHSKYGIGEEIYINNSEGYYTGRSGGNVGGSVNKVNVQYPDQTSTYQYNTYGYYTWLGQAVETDGTIGAISDVTQGTKASTTGNVTGVYDMSGGAWEYVMGVLADASGNPRSGYSSSSSSGFNGALYSGSKTDGINFPESSFYDLYTSVSTKTACNGGPCFGHALHETYGWYSDYKYFVSSSSPWFGRGGSCYYGSYAGAFGFYNDGGNALGDGSWRSVLFAS